jgi:sugar phosphate isomerase/epimerase
VTTYVSTTYAPDGFPVTQVVAELYGGGVHHIELGSTHVPEPGVAEALLEVGADYVVHNYFPPPDEPFVVNLASADEGLRRRSLDHARQSLVFAGRIGAGVYTVHPGFLGDPIGPGRSDGGTYDFQFDPQRPSADLRHSAFRRCVDAIAALSRIAQEEGVRLAVESEGSATKWDRLLLQTPDEFEEFASAIPQAAAGINVNVGHLNLASKVFSFEPLTFLDQVAPRVVAFELSHNDGTRDQHLPPRPGHWYESILTDSRFAEIPMIIECRATPIEEVLEAYRWVSLVRGDSNWEQ